MNKQMNRLCSDEVKIPCPVDECDGTLLATVTPEELSDLDNCGECTHAQEAWDDRRLYLIAWERATEAAADHEAMLYDVEMDNRIARRLGK